MKIESNNFKTQLTNAIEQDILDCMLDTSKIMQYGQMSNTKKDYEIC